MILYLHGFRSSPQSFKARVIGQHMAALGLQDQYVCPQLPASPAGAIALAGALVAGVDPAQLTVVGSSLGGYYATWLAEHPAAGRCWSTRRSSRRATWNPMSA